VHATDPVQAHADAMVTAVAWVSPVIAASS
jgi:hypothetical protein